MKELIPIFYACDDNFVKYTIVSLHSMIQNASPDFDYRVYVLHTNITSGTRQKVLELEKRLIGQAAFYRLGCNTEPEAALVAWKGMHADMR